MSNWKTEVHELSGIMRIEHSFWGQLSNITNDGGYVYGQIKFINTSQIPIEDVWVYLDLDDNKITIVVFV